MTQISILKKTSLNSNPNAPIYDNECSVATQSCCPHTRTHTTMRCDDVHNELRNRPECVDSASRSGHHIRRLSFHEQGQTITGAITFGIYWIVLAFAYERLNWATQTKTTHITHSRMLARSESNKIDRIRTLMGHPPSISSLAPSDLSLFPSVMENSRGTYCSYVETFRVRVC